MIMPLTNQQKRDIAQDINKILERYGIYYKGSLLKVDPANINEIIPDYVFEDKMFKKYFTSLSAAKMDSIYAYKNFPYVLQMLTNDELHFTSLKLNEQNDPSEYLETTLRCMYIQPFIADDYVGQSSGLKGNHCYFKNANGSLLPIEEQRQKTYIYCLTNTYNLNRHWSEYATDETGVCIEYSFEMPHPNVHTWLSYGRIHYDEGYDCDFIKEINLMMIRKYGKTFTPVGIAKFATMVKREKYRWEDELRIVLLGNNAENVSFQEDPNAPGVVKIKNGTLFQWKIKRVIAGNKIDSNNLSQLQSVCNYRNIPLII